MKRSSCGFLTSHDTLGNTGLQDRLLARGVRRALLHLSRCRSDRGRSFTARGGSRLSTPVSDTPEGQTELTRRFKQDPAAQDDNGKHLAAQHDVKALWVTTRSFIPAVTGRCGIWRKIRVQLPSSRPSTVPANRSLPSLPCQPRRTPSACPSSRASQLVQGKRVTESATCDNEDAVHLTKVVPFLVEDELKRLGALYEKVENWKAFVVSDGRLMHRPESGLVQACGRGAAKTSRLIEVPACIAIG